MFAKTARESVFHCLKRQSSRWMTCCGSVAPVACPIPPLPHSLPFLCWMRSPFHIRLLHCNQLTEMRLSSFPPSTPQSSNVSKGRRAGRLRLGGRAAHHGTHSADHRNSLAQFELNHDGDTAATPAECDSVSDGGNDDSLVKPSSP